MAFNRGMNSLDQDKALIESLGGPAKLAETLGYEKDGGVQRVQNWLSRGIPAAVKVKHPDLFLRELKTEGAQPTARADHRRTPPPSHQGPNRNPERRTPSRSDKPSNRKGR